MKSINFHLLYSTLLLFSCNESDNNLISKEESFEIIYTTTNILTDIDENSYNDDESVKANSIYSWSSDETNRILNGNGIPNH